jgi:hypothetical protein
MHLTGVWTVFTPDNSPIPWDHDVVQLTTCKQGVGVWLGIVGNVLALDPDSAPTTTGNVSILYYDEGFWTAYPSEMLGFTAHEIGRMGCGSDGRLWIHRLPNEIHVFDGEEIVDYQVVQHGLPSGFGVVHPLSFVMEPTGGVWVSLDQSGIGWFLDGEWQVFTHENSSLPQGEVTALTIDQEGYVWGSIVEGSVDGPNKLIIVRFANESWRVYARIPIRLYENYVSCMAIDYEGKVWIGWSPGWGPARGPTLWRIDRDKREVIKYNRKNALLTSHEIHSIVIDKRGRVWVGTGDSILVFSGDEQGVWRVIAPDVHATPQGSKYASMPGNPDQQRLVNVGGMLDVDSNGNIYSKCSSGFAIFTEV